MTDSEIVIALIRAEVAKVSDGPTAPREVVRWAARRVLNQEPRLCMTVIEAIGSWPSSEPELAALQQEYRTSLER